MIQLGAPRAAAAIGLAADAQAALEPDHLSRFLYQAYHPDAPVSCVSAWGGESRRREYSGLAAALCIAGLPVAANTP